jgi:hypothetical protein
MLYLLTSEGVGKKFLIDDWLDDLEEQEDWFEICLAVWML